MIGRQLLTEEGRLLDIDTQTNEDKHQEEQTQDRGFLGRGPHEVRLCVRHLGQTRDIGDEGGGVPA